MVYYYEKIWIIILSYTYKIIIYYVASMAKVTKGLFNILEFIGQKFLVWNEDAIMNLEIQGLDILYWK